ncbi:MAG: SO_0444 family Cu/Zn efflux transporter [Gammaproteobacteria bacterium]|nr:SO_0444 family Cu/Zn efflux transporter [Gammaproteobacteria bacterium]
MEKIEQFGKLLLELPPWLLLGLLLAGVIHVFVSRHAILRWLRRDSLGSVSTSAAIGIPLPLCSCSVVPVVAEMRHKGASRSACMSFLITTPETGVDSILITNALFGWVAAVVRPLVSFVTAVVAGLSAIGLLKKTPNELPEKNTTTSCNTKDDCCEEETHDYLIPAEQDCHISLRQLKHATANTFSQTKVRLATWLRPKTKMAPTGTMSYEPSEKRLTLGRIGKHVFQYGFVDLADDILTAMLIGIVLGAVITFAVPEGIMNSGYAVWLQYPAMLLMGVPLYICASASTPIAAAWVLKGVSPGAALIFLMTGPATNTTTIAMILKQFGARFATIYVSSVVVVTTLFGIAVDVLIFMTGFELFAVAGHEHEDINILSWACVALFAALLIWRSLDGALVRGWKEMFSNFRPAFSGVRRGR